MRVLIILSLMFFSCKTTYNSKEKFYKNNSYTTQSEKILGVWKICKMKGNGRVIHSNICKTIKFDEDSNGELLMEDEKICTFNWIIEKDSVILFSFNSLEDQKRFLYGSTEYNFKFSNDDKLEYLEISPKRESTIYILSRAIGNVSD